MNDCIELTSLTETIDEWRQKLDQIISDLHVLLP